jgi:hypothetical protein
MSIVRCPRCRDEVTIPAKAPLTALVRCPLCHEKYLLSEAASQLPPALILVVSELEPKAADQHATNDAPDADDYRLGEIQGGLIETQASFQPPVRLAPRPVRKEKNALAEAAKIIGGGIAGLAMGLVVLWWGLRQDPLELGPSVATYVPWLVPQEFHALRKSGSVTVTKTPRPVTVSSPNETGESQRQHQENKFKLSQPPTPSEPATIDLPAVPTRNEARQISATEPVPDVPTAPMPDLRDLLPDGPSAPRPLSPRN